MTLPVVPGSSLSLSQVNTELNYSSTAQISLNDSAVRVLAGVGASPATISFNDLSGKSNTFSFSIASSQIQADLRSLAVSAGWNGTSKVIATINSGVYVYSNSTGSAALTIAGSFPNGVELVNNGVIIGRGGDGGAGGSASGVMGRGNGGNGGGGGTALNVSTAVSITNNSIIAGGGGGGGGGGTSTTGNKTLGGGGGGGGGGIGNSSGGAAGAYGAYVSSAGAGGSLTSAGSGGSGASANGIGMTGGNGGSYGSAGAAANPATGLGPYQGSPGSGGGAGSCTSGNGYITWIATGSRYGPLN